MATLDIKAPDGKTLTVQVPPGADPNSYGSLAEDAVKHYVSASQPPPLISSSQVTPAQQQQWPISSMISKGLGTGMEALSAPFQVAGEAIRGAGAGEPLQVATAKNPQGFRVPTLLQHIMPSLRTPEAPADPFQQAAMGLKGVATTAASLPQGPGQAIQAGAQAVQGPPGLAENIGAMALGAGTGEAGNLPFTAAVKSLGIIPELAKTGEAMGIPGVGMVAKSITDMDTLPLGVNHLTAKANAEILEAATKGKVPATPGMLTGSPTLNGIESFGKKLPFASNIFQKRFGQIYDAMKNMREPIVETSKPAADLGLDVQEAISNTSNMAYKNSQSLYQNAENAIPEGVKIPVNQLSATASDVLKAQAKLPAGAQVSAASQLLKDLAGQGFEGKDIGRIMPEGSQVTGKAVSEFDYPTLQALRAELNDRISKANSAFGSQQPGAKFQSSPEALIYGKLKNALDQDLSTFSDNTGGVFKSALDNANKTYGTYKDVYKNDNFVQSILNEQNPEKIVDKVIKAAKDNPRALGTLKLNLPTQTLNDLQTYFVKDMTEKDPNIFSPSHFVRQYDSIGEKQLTNILGPEKMEQLRPLYVLSKAGVNAEGAGQSVSGPSGAGVGSSMMLRQPIQALVTGAATGKLVGGSLKAAALGGAMMEALPLAAHAYLSEPVGKLLTRQASIPSFPAAAEMAPIVGKTQASVADLIQQLKDKYAQRKKM